MVYSIVKTWLTWVYISNCILSQKVCEHIYLQHVTQCQLSKREVFVNVCIVLKSHKDTLQIS